MGPDTQVQRPNQATTNNDAQDAKLEQLQVPPAESPQGRSGGLFSRVQRYYESDFDTYEKRKAFLLRKDIGESNAAILAELEGDKFLTLWGNMKITEHLDADRVLKMLNLDGDALRTLTWGYDREIAQSLAKLNDRAFDNAITLLSNEDVVLKKEDSIIIAEALEGEKFDRAAKLAKNRWLSADEIIEIASFEGAMSDKVMRMAVDVEIIRKIRVEGIITIASSLEGAAFDTAMDLLQDKHAGFLLRDDWARVDVNRVLELSKLQGKELDRAKQIEVRELNRDVHLQQIEEIREKYRKIVTGDYIPAPPEMITKLGLECISTGPDESVCRIAGQEWSMRIEERDEHVILRNKENEDISIFIGKIYGSDNAQTMEAYTRKALESYESERRDDCEIAAFDLVKDRPVAIITWADRNAGEIERDVQATKDLASVLATRINVYNSREEIVHGGATDDALGAMRSYLTELHSQGVRDFFLNILAHGDKEGIKFSHDGEDTLRSSGGIQNVKAEDILRLFQEFPDSSFTVSTLSCHGGGFSQAMDEMKDYDGAPDGRINVFTQTKIEDVNISFRPDIMRHGPYYYVALMKYLLEDDPKLTYGQAHLKADQETRRLTGLDAEAMSSRAGERSKHTG